MVISMIRTAVIGMGNMGSRYAGIREKDPEEINSIYGLKASNCGQMY